MTAFIESNEWLHFVEQEYLASFIKNGGSSVKFCVAPDEPASRSIRDGLSRAGGTLGYIVASVSASETRIQMMDELFFRTAEQLSWTELTRNVLRGLAVQAGYKWPALITQEDNVPLSELIAAENGLEPQLLLLDLKRQIGHRVFKDRKLSKDFRVAMTHLCMAELSGGTDGALTTRVLTDWLTGRNKAIGPLKDYQIFRRINRSSARYFFESLLHWVRLASCSGLLLLMDVSRMIGPRNLEDRGIYYTKAALLDSYEVLREFIDGADRVSGFLMVVLPGAAFLEDHSRGLSAYEALKFRVFDEIRDKRLVNPMGSLVRIASGLGGNA